MKKILFIVGSFRAGSFNRQLAEYILSRLEGRAEAEFLDYGDLPFMNQDLEFPPPPAVERVRAAVSGSDGLWICSPEYNHHIPGALKNLLDWLSRPVGDRKSPSVLRGKPVTFSCAAGKNKARYILSALEEFSLLTGMEALPGFGIALSGEDFAADILPLSGETKQALDAQIADFLQKMP